MTHQPDDFIDSVVANARAARSDRKVQEAELARCWDKIARVLAVSRAWEQWHHGGEGKLGKHGFAVEWALAKVVRELREEFPEPIPSNNPGFDLEALLAQAPEPKKVSEPVDV